MAAEREWRRRSCRGALGCLALPGVKSRYTAERMEPAGGPAEKGCGPAGGTSAGGWESGGHGGWAGGAGGNWMATHPTVGLCVGRARRGAGGGGDAVRAQPAEAGGGSQSLWGRSRFPARAYCPGP